MRYIIFLIIIIALLQVSCSKDEDEVPNQNSQIKTLSESQFSAKKENGEIEKGSLIGRTISEYDTDGKIMKKKSYDSKNQLLYYSVFIYNNLGQIMQEEFYANNQLSYKIEYDYDTIGDLIRESYNGIGDYNTYIVYIYDGKRNLIEAQNFKSDGSLASKFTYNHDSNGNVVEEKYFHPSDFLSWRKISKYDNKGNLTEVNDYYTGGELASIITFKYDDKGNLIEEKTTNPLNGGFHKTTFTYNNFDKMNNWLQRVEFFNDEPVAMTEREIEYYL